MALLDFSNFDGNLKSHEGLVGSDALKGKYVGLYFSAHWCPPCRRFTPLLRKTYNQLKSEGKNLEIIFVSFDNNASGFNEYYDGMPWLAVPFESSLRDKLATQYYVNSIPTLIMFDPNGQAINRDARSAVEYNPNGFPWSV